MVTFGVKGIEPALHDPVENLNNIAETETQQDTVEHNDDIYVETPRWESNLRTQAQQDQEPNPTAPQPERQNELEQILKNTRRKKT